MDKEKHYKIEFETIDENGETLKKQYENVEDFVDEYWSNDEDIEMPDETDKVLWAKINDLDVEFEYFIDLLNALGIRG